MFAAYALQADYGNCHNVTHSYFDPREYFPAWVSDLSVSPAVIWLQLNLKLKFVNLNLRKIILTSLNLLFTYLL